MSESIKLELTRDEALVLFEYFHRCEDDHSLTFVDQAEERALWTIEGQLEKQLVEIFDPRYGELLAAARQRLRDPVD